MVLTRLRRRRGSYVVATLAAVAVCSLAAIMYFGGGGRSAPAPASDISSYLRVCMIAKAGDPDATRIWAGVQQAAATTKKVNAQQTAVPTYATNSANDVLAYAGGLRQQHCAVTVAVGDFLHDSVQAGLSSASGSTYIYVSRAPVRSASVVDLQPEQATTERVASETVSMIENVGKT